MVKKNDTEEGTLEEELVKHLGKDSAQLASGELDSDVTQYVSTQCATLDYAIGRPGIPVGRLTVVLGKEGSGKSTVAYHLLAETQRCGGVALLIDSESSYDRDRGVRLGINEEQLVVLTAPTMEDTFAEIKEVIQFIRKRSTDQLITIVWDSLSGSPHKKQLEADPGTGAVGRAALIVSQELPGLHKLLAKHKVALVIVNQLRQFIDPSGFGDFRSSGRRKVMKQNTMIAEASLIFWGSLFIHFTSTGLLGDRESPHGVSVQAHIRKSKVSPNEGWKAELDIDALTGVDIDGSKMNLLLKLGIVAQAGGWYTWDEVPKFRRTDWPQVLADNPVLEEMVVEAPLLWKSEE